MAARVGCSLKSAQKSKMPKKTTPSFPTTVEKYILQIGKLSGHVLKAFSFVKVEHEILPLQQTLNPLFVKLGHILALSSDSQSTLNNFLWQLKFLRLQSLHHEIQ